MVSVHKSAAKAGARKRSPVAAGGVASDWVAALRRLIATADAHDSQLRRLREDHDLLFAQAHELQRCLQKAGVMPTRPPSADVAKRAARSKEARAKTAPLTHSRREVVRKDQIWEPSPSVIPYHERESFVDTITRTNQEFHQYQDLWELCRPLLEGVETSSKTRIHEIQEVLRVCGPPDEWNCPLPPVVAAANSGNVELAQLFLRARASANATDHAGLSALHLAASGGHYTVCRHIVAAYGEVNACDSLGQTPLFFASRSAVCKALVEGKAKLRIVNARGQTALHLAALQDHSEVLAWLSTRVPRSFYELHDIFGRTAEMCHRLRGSNRLEDRVESRPNSVARSRLLDVEAVEPGVRIESPVPRFIRSVIESSLTGSPANEVVADSPRRTSQHEADTVSPEASRIEVAESWIVQDSAQDESSLAWVPATVHMLPCGQNSEADGAVACITKNNETPLEADAVSPVASPTRVAAFSMTKDIAQVEATLTRARVPIHVPSRTDSDASKTVYSTPHEANAVSTKISPTQEAGSCIAKDSVPVESSLTWGCVPLNLPSRADETPLEAHAVSPVASPTKEAGSSMTKGIAQVKTALSWARVPVHVPSRTDSDASKISPTEEVESCLAKDSAPVESSLTWGCVPLNLPSGTDSDASKTVHSITEANEAPHEADVVSPEISPIEVARGYNAKQSAQVESSLTWGCVPLHRPSRTDSDAEQTVGCIPEADETPRTADAPSSEKSPTEVVRSSIAKGDAQLGSALTWGCVPVRSINVANETPHEADVVSPTQDESSLTWGSVPVRKLGSETDGDAPQAESSFTPARGCLADKLSTSVDIW
eukprot:TRINITY_DN3276_c0_g1_i4.p1 TRINITY_DN3276_c0_g1~~TRINITY_DN3276_c0_g1_i4.p1  ORF type:complete len:853 (-),score=96.41 TRINITY_DN3276_c0_g1_i4:386-2875(-)